MVQACQEKLMGAAIFCGKFIVYFRHSGASVTENAKIVGPTDRTGQNIKRSDAHDDRVRPIVRIRLIHCTRSFHSVTLTDMKI